MIRNFTAAAAAITCIAALTSCGRILMPEGENVVGGAAATSTVPVTTAETAAEIVAVTEAATEATTVFGAPARVEIDTKMPEGYQLGSKSAVYVETVLQKPELPTGCEITALTELMNFYGFAADKVEMSDVFMKIDHVGYYSMNDAYLGDPHLDNGFGCNAPVIVRAADDYFDYIGSDWYAVDLTGSSIEEVYYQTEQGRPVVVWTTISQYETYPEYQFTLGCGEDFYFNPFQHCVVVYGFDYEDGTVHVADPLEGNRKYDMARFERIYEILGKQAVVLCGNESSAGTDYTTDEEKAAWLAENRPSDWNSEAALW